MALGIFDIEPLLSANRVRRARTRGRTRSRGTRRHPVFDAPIEDKSDLEIMLEQAQLKTLKEYLEKQEKEKEKKPDEKKKRWYEDPGKMTTVIFISAYLMLPIQLLVIASIFSKFVK